MNAYNQGVNKTMSALCLKDTGQKCTTDCGRNSSKGSKIKVSHWWWMVAFSYPVGGMEVGQCESSDEQLEARFFRAEPGGSWVRHEKSGPPATHPMTHAAPLPSHWPGTKTQPSVADVYQNVLSLVSLVLFSSHVAPVRLFVTSW